MTFREITELAFAAAGKPAKIRSLPRWTVWPVAKVIRSFNVNVASLVAMLAAAAEDDAVSVKTGDHHLADLFAEQAAAPAKE